VKPPMPSDYMVIRNVPPAGLFEFYSLFNGIKLIHDTLLNEAFKNYVFS